MEGTSLDTRGKPANSSHFSVLLILLTLQGEPLAVTSKLYEGWMLDSEDRRLFWIPPSLREGLLRPGAELIIGNMIKTRFNLDSFVYGVTWTSCRGTGLPAL